MDRFINLPADGTGVYCPSPKPTHLRVTEAPGAVSDSDLKALIASLCTGRGLQLGVGEGPAVRPEYSMNFRILVRLAYTRGIEVPASIQKDVEVLRRKEERSGLGNGVADLV